MYGNDLLMSLDARGKTEFQHYQCIDAITDATVGTTEYTTFYQLLG